MSPTFEAKMEALSDFKSGVESILEMVAQIRDSHKADQESPKKARKRRTASGD